MREVKGIDYNKKLELFQKRLQELSSAIEVQSTPQRNNTQLKDIVQKLDLDNESYFSISYFYEGLQNTKEVLDGNRDSIHFMLWVLCSVVFEQYLRNSTDSIFGIFDELYNKKYYYTIQSRTSGVTQTVLELSNYEKEFITHKLPYLKNHWEINKINAKIDDPKATFQEMCTNLDNKEQNVEKILSEYQNRADTLVAFIKTQQTNLNFVGLGKAFEQITKEKEDNKSSIKFWLVILFLLLITIPLCVAYSLVKQSEPNLYVCIPATAIEILLLYAFRLFYQQYLFVKSELLQVNLRHNLCAFIESYMEFKKNNKDNTVDLFEQLIFSNIISDEKKVPATVDGLESVAELIRCLKK